jgi:hypothetical protein
MKRRIIFLFIIANIFNNINAFPSDSDTIIGTWTATVEHNRSFDTYRINFTSDGRCTVKVSNDNAEQETTGNWSWDGTLFRLNATFRNPRISYLPNIQWSSVINFSPDNNSFNILGRTATGGSQTRITFFRHDGFDDEFNERVIPQIFIALSQNIPPRSRLAVVGITSPNPNEAAFYLNELTLHFVNTGNYTVVDRTNIDTVLAEQDFQLSDYVDDYEMASFGRFLGANVVITGSISGIGPQKRMVIKAIDVSTSEILSMVSMPL